MLRPPRVAPIMFGRPVGTIGWNLVMLVYVRRAMGIDASAMALAPRAA